jgi:hypothetical protein
MAIAVRRDLAVLLDDLELRAVERRHVDLERGPHGGRKGYASSSEAARS